MYQSVDIMNKVIEMIFAIKYKKHTVAIFFDIWNVTQYINNCFSEEELDFVTVDRITDNMNLRKKIEETDIIDTTVHCCGNCARSLTDNNILVCDFTQEEVGIEDYCVHYV